MVVQHNLRAMNANRMLGITQGTLSKSAEKLSSGYKVNRAADDAAGLSISEKMRKQIRGLSQASLNAEDGISAVQTAEGALTEVHDMLQRMNELAVKASNGTNALSDRQTIQDEVDQLLTEIDRVSETTKFNETYLLKGDKDTKTVTVNAQDAGIDGTLTQNTTKATFTMDKLSLGDTIKIGGTEYTIGGQLSEVTASLANISAGELVTIDGTQYTVTDGDNNADKNILKKDDIIAKVAAGSTVVYKGNTLQAMIKDDGTDLGANSAAQSAVDPKKPQVITAQKAYEMIDQELRLASSIGATKTSATQTKGFAENATDTTKMDFYITKGTVERKEGLTFALHVGADADMTNKISVQIDALDTAGLGIQGLNVKDSSGAAATYAIDAIADAVSHVSAQRSLLGAVQNRLEHTINNLDNVVENTTAAESQIRDTDMATEMVKYSNANILSQAGQSMLAQGNQANQGVLSLLG
ncbi:MAG: flagellar hook protein [Lachnospiraceae bacterium]|nr:flagellar hook protein [Lachnospiraceae bacterium]MDE6998828.1 flagellar hook protein [Lachnospiraceae bacterium]